MKIQKITINLLELNKNEIEFLIIENLGLKVEVIKKENKILILLQNNKSCFRLMEKLHYDFNFIVHKQGKKYIIEL